ncbi:hypothetical protein PanWU01x14_037590, partial [Parasponia andersonii]
PLSTLQSRGSRCAHLCGKETHGQSEPYLPNAGRLSNAPDNSHSTMLSPGSR